MKVIKAEKITILPGVSYIFKSLAETSAIAQADLSTLKLCFCAGNFLGKDVFDKFLVLAYKARVKFVEK
ncbi:hypothetical protein WA1_09145 [Scytonema hofmannii PCC 7110]|uniref:Uncharacterized protein n=1 Tax=Scytonema hofmannii PCC 7110 TaxID=128403 RepID=A0A139WS84_9CYAN|nr:hypothetical protein WA1_09145 [Scytonema hofmannii PCC 7110]